MACRFLVLPPGTEPGPLAVNARRPQGNPRKLSYFLWLPSWHSGKGSAWQCRRRRRCGFSLWVGKIPWGRKSQPTPVILPGESLGPRSLAGCSPWGCTESDTTAHTHPSCEQSCCSYAPSTRPSQRRLKPHDGHLQPSRASRSSENKSPPTASKALHSLALPLLTSSPPHLPHLPLPPRSSSATHLSPC